MVGIASGFRHFGPGGAYFGGAQWWSLYTDEFTAPITTDWGNSYAAESVSADGSVVIASLKPGQEIDDVIIWAEKWDWEAVRLGQLLSDFGIEIAEEDETYQLARLSDYLGGPAISDDGSTIVGTYIFTKGTRSTMTGFIFRMYDRWGEYKVTESFVNTENWLGNLCVACEPWIWCEDLDSFLYIDENCADTGTGWMYAPELNCMNLSILSSGISKLGWSHKLGRWFYVPEATLVEDSGWIYAL